MIVLTTPTGSIGSQILLDLVDTEENLRVVVRDPEKIPAPIRERVEIVVGSHADPEVVDRAFDGADTLFWLVPPDYRAESIEKAYLDFTRPACAAIRKRGVGRVVAVSALGRGTPWEGQAGLIDGALGMEDLIAATDVAFRALTMPGFMDNVLMQVGAIAGQGAFFSPFAGDHKSPTCATRDIAAAAVRLLRDRSWTGQGRVAVLGPEDLSPNDMAEILSEVLGRPVRHERITFEALGDQLRERGALEAIVRAYVDMMKAKDAGMDDAEPRTPESTTPTPFRRWCAEIVKPAISSYEAAS